MQLATILAALMTAGARASPIETRQFPFHGNGSISLYSEPGCRDSNVLAKDVEIFSGCNILNMPVASVKFNGGTPVGTLPVTSEFQLYPPHMGEHPELIYLPK